MIDKWADKLIFEYSQGLEGLHHLREQLPDNLDGEIDKSYINSMIDSMSYSLEWMKNGRQPGVYRGVDKKDAYRVLQYEDMDIIPDIKEQYGERERLYMTSEQKEDLLHLLNRFSERERQCFIMYEAEQLTMQQIADELGISKATVQSYINRARTKVKELTA